MITEKGETVSIHIKAEDIIKSLALLEEMIDFCKEQFEEGAKDTADALTCATETMRAFYHMTFDDAKITDNLWHWHECFPEDPDSFPDDDRLVLCSFRNFSGVIIGRWEVDDDGGGAWYVGDMYETFSEYDVFVDGWWELPEKPEVDEDA